MSRSIGFIGVGKMGSGMIQNLAKRYQVLAFDNNPKFMDTLTDPKNIHPMKSIKDLAGNTDTFVCMLPNDKIVRDVCDGNDGLFKHSTKNSLVIDCSTISPFTAIDLNEIAKKQHQNYVDAPVSGGVGAASKGTLTFMVGTDNEEIFKLCNEVLDTMGKNVFDCKRPGGGQSAKICNNMALGIEMVAVAEALALGVKLGLDPKLLTQIMNVSSSRCWSSDTYNPAPGVMPSVPSSNNYEGGFASELMLKDLTIATDVAHRTNQQVPLGDHTKEIYKKLNEMGLSRKDFTIIYKQLLDGKL